MKKILLSITILAFLMQLSFAQDTITLLSSREAHLRYTSRPGYTYYQTTNYNSYTLHRSYEWTTSGYPLKFRALMDFDLSSIPENAHIIDAQLYLYGTGYHVTNLTTGSSTYKSNASYLRRVITSWHEDTVTWNTMPTVTTTNQETIPNSSTSDEDYTVDVTSLIQDMITYPSNSHGLMLQLVTESPYTEMRFASGDYTTDTTMVPELVIEYIHTSHYDIGEGDIVTGQTNYLYSNPFSTSQRDSRGQFLYLASELEARGMVAGDIYSLAFDVVDPDLQLEALNVRIGQTTSSSLGSSYLTGLTTVYSDSYVPQAGWNTIVFSAPFTWDGTSNLVVEACYHNAFPFNFNNSTVVLTNTGFNSIRGDATTNGTFGCSMTTGYLRTTRPRIRLKADRGSIPYSAVTEVTSYSSQPASTNNYVRSATALTGSGSSASTILGSTLDPREVNESVEYIDGLGRSIQSVAVCASPGGKDLVKPITYDEYGRVVYNFLAYPADNISGYNAGFRNESWESTSSYSNAQLAFYQDHFDMGYSTPYAYSESILESSPLSRIMAQGSPGENWQPTGTDGLSGHTVRYEYTTNTETTNEDVRLWTISGSTCTSTDFYEDDELYKTIVYSEDYDDTSNEDAFTVEYKDKQGRVVLKEAFLSSESYPLRTYYLYDDFGLLRYVFPPEYSDTFSGSTSTLSYTPTTTGIINYCYYYAYDGRKRMIEKQLPGADKIYLIYDNRDRLVLTQDGKLRDDEGSAYYLFTLYDHLNRPVVNGQCSHGSNTLAQTRTSIQADALYFVERDNSDDGYDLGDGLPSGFTITEYYSYTYYDDYTFRSYVTGCSGLTFSTTHEISEYVDSDGSSNGYYDYVKGQVTGTRSLVLDGTGTSWVNAITYYDDRYRPIQIHSNMYPSGTSIVSNDFDFVGNINRTKETQTVGSNSSELLTLYTYDHGGRLLETRISVDEADDVLLAQNIYNELGELIEKNLHSDDDEMVVQSIDYNYNIRGWLTNINEIGDFEETDYFAMELLYDVVNTNISNTALYNGNISATLWSGIGSTDVYSYGFEYDEINRIESADYRERINGTWNNETFYETTYSYDLNGNIGTLTRNDDAGTEIDDLSYNYTGNLLKKIEDDGTTAGMYDGYTSTTIDDYLYDDNGNMIKDLNKNIEVDYNYLNLPEKVYEVGGNDDEISYIYDASGVKWLKKVDNGSLTNTAYCGSFVYEDAGATGTYALDYILNTEGRIDFDQSNYTFNYILKDHLGNTRVEFDEDGNINQKASYYPFGMIYGSQLGGDNKYLYNGKELQDEQLGNINLDWYSYGARYYDPALARWHVSDPLSEKYYSLSPYTYVANNPIRLIDPNGMEITGDTTAVNNLEDQAARGVKTEQRRQARMQNQMSKRTSKGKGTKSLNRRMGRSEFREANYQATVDEIGTLRASDNIYEVNTNYVSSTSDGNTEYVSTDSKGNHTIRVNVSQSYLQNGGLAHEFVHGYQFETGNMDFQYSGSPGLLYDIGDEVSAFQRQLVVAGNSTMYNVSPSYVRNLNPALYSHLPNGHLNVTSSYFVLMFHHGRFIEGGTRFIHTPYKNIGYSLIYNK